jgi:hypothetical protein
MLDHDNNIVAPFRRIEVQLFRDRHTGAVRVDVAMDGKCCNGLAPDEAIGQVIALMMANGICPRAYPMMNDEDWIYDWEARNLRRRSLDDAPSSHANEVVQVAQPAPAPLPDCTCGHPQLGMSWQHEGTCPRWEIPF